MSPQEILFEVDLGKRRTKAIRECKHIVGAGLLAIVLCLFLLNRDFRLPVCSVIVFIIGLACITILQFSRWKKEPGNYRIYIDSIGLHVHSDEPQLGESFSVASSRIHSLIRRTKSVDPDIYEYFVEEITGKRHEVKICTNHLVHVDVMAIFEQIADHYPSVKLIEERWC